MFIQSNRTWTVSFALVGVLFALSAGAGAPAAKPSAPVVLPGKGLAQYDFFYAGEAKDERMLIVRGGKIVWDYTHNGKGEISDAVMQPNGNILFAHQYGVTEVNADKQVVWNHDAPPNTEIHTARYFGANSVWFIQNGNPAKFIVINKTTGAIGNEFVLPVKNPGGIHGQFRHACMTDAGTLLVAHMDMGKAAEYSLDGKELWSVPVPGVWSATPLQNGNRLMVSNRGFAREVNRAGETVWEWKPSDTPEFKMSSLQLAWRLPNGNTLINNWFNQWSGVKLDPATAEVQAIELTPDKKVVWALRSWEGAENLGPATTIQILERQVIEAPLDGIIQRYGLLYGPGTGFDAPIAPGSVHVDAAAKAAELAVTHGSSGIYNVAETDGTTSSDKAIQSFGWDAGWRFGK